ncbi:MAG: hypothetical protein EOP51_30985 [Sphingobacteriales bacterium]|nr:MAG: hypothetical protein EOP51_30985 [Sphingobacteriales bacterium]
MKKSFFAVIIIIFIVLNGVFYWLKINQPQFSYNVLMTGNVVMAALSLISYVLITRKIDARPAAFVNGVYGSSFLKLFVCMISILTYAMVNKPHVHKPSLFALLGIYAVYSAAETIILSKMARNVK